MAMTSDDGMDGTAMGDITITITLTLTTSQVIRAIRRRSARRRHAAATGCA